MDVKNQVIKPRTRKQEIQWTVFTALHGMQTRSGDENLSVCVSVRLSNACIVTKRKKDLSRLLYHTNSFSLVSSEEEWLVGGDPFYLKFWVNRLPLERNRRFWTDNRSYRLSRNTYSEKSSINTNRRFTSTTRFPMSPRRTSHVVPISPPKRGRLKNAKCPKFEQ